MSIGTEEQLYRVLCDVVPRRDQAALWAMRRPALRIRPDGHTAADVPDSRLGGRPLAAPGRRWPESERGPLDLVAQFELAEVARLLPGSPLPDHGLLLFFYDTETPAWSVTPADPTGWRVYWEPAAVEPIPLPADWVEFPAAKVRLEQSVTLPRATEDDLDLDEHDDAVGAQLRARSALDDEYGHLPVHHQLLGWPHLLQGSMTSQCQRESTSYADDSLDTATRDAEWQLLLQLGSENLEGWSWGDGGGLYFWIRRADLMGRRFDRVWTVMQC